MKDTLPGAVETSKRGQFDAYLVEKYGDLRQGLYLESQPLVHRNGIEVLLRSLKIIIFSSKYGIFNLLRVQEERVSDHSGASAERPLWVSRGSSSASRGSREPQSSGSDGTTGGRSGDPVGPYLETYSADRLHTC